MNQGKRPTGGTVRIGMRLREPLLESKGADSIVKWVFLSKEKAVQDAVGV